MDVTETCSKAFENEASQILAIVLSIVFCVWIGATIVVTAIELNQVTAEASRLGGKSSEAPGLKS